MEVQRLPSDGAVAVRGVFNFVLTDTEYLVPGKETRFFVNTRQFVCVDYVKDEAPWPKSLSDCNLHGPGGYLPAGYAALGCRLLEFPSEIRVSVKNLETKKSGLKALALPAPQVFVGGRPLEQPDGFDLQSCEAFEVRLPPVEGLLFQVPIQCHVICRLFLRPLIG